MKIMKERTMPHLLRVMQQLNKRQALTNADRQYMVNLEKGYQGECYFDNVLKEEVKGDVVVLNDLLLSVNHTYVQIDSLVMTGSTIYLYEIKNYEGEFVNKSDHLLTKTGHEISNPLTQLSRSTTLLKQHLRNSGHSFPVQAFVVYVHPSFVLHESTLESKLLMPSQVRSHLAELNRRSSHLKKKHNDLASKLVLAHVEDNPFKQTVTPYTVESVKRGLTCLSCGSFDLILTRRSSFCSTCQYKSLLPDSIDAHIKEFKLLFPDERVTRHTIVEWCGGKVSDRVVWTVLKTRYNPKGSKRTRYYI